MSIFEFDSNPLIFQSRFYVTGLFNNYLPAIYKFHNIHHTLNVVQFCHELGEYYRLTKTDMEKLLLAAWFHDTGYCLNIDDHESASVTIVSTFLDSQNVTENYMPSVENLILATKRLREPVMLAEQIICFFNSHRYFTDYAQIMWGGQKLKNLNQLKAGK